MITRCLSILVLFIFLSVNASDKVIYVLPINDEIGAMTWQHTRRACDEAQQCNADMLIVHLNTYGGLLAQADSIRTRLMNFPRPVVCFVDNNAASAGALIALACDSVYMRPGASMGAATVVDGNGDALPDKYQSFMRAMMRATAEQHGKVLNDGDSIATWRRDPLIAEAMVDSRIIVPGLVDSTKVVTFTADEARKWNYSDGEASSIDDLIHKLDAFNCKIVSFKPNFTDWLIGFFSNPAIQAVLIMLIIGGIYFELQSPGLGFPSVVSIVAAILYFLPLYITGIASSWIIILFVIGLIFLLLEIFVIPGFGVTGIIGGCMMIVALIGGLVDNITHEGFVFSDLWHALAIVGVGIVMSVLLIMFLTSRYGPKSFVRYSALQLSQRIEDGYIGVDMKPAKYIGMEGIAITDMHPVGKIEINSVTYDAVALNGFIDKGSGVVIEKYENSQLYVSKISHYE